jgi:hypothetical protein
MAQLTIRGTTLAGVTYDLLTLKDVNEMEVEASIWGFSEHLLDLDRQDFMWVSDTTIIQPKQFTVFSFEVIED